MMSNERVKLVSKLILLKESKERNSNSYLNLNALISVLARN